MVFAFIGKRCAVRSGRQLDTVLSGKVYAVIGVYIRRCVETGKMRGSILCEAYLIRRKAFAENVAVIVGVCKPFNGYAFVFEVYAEFAFYCAQSALQGRFPRAGAQHKGCEGQQNNNIF